MSACPRVIRRYQVCHYSTSNGCSPSTSVQVVLQGNIHCWLSFLPSTAGRFGCRPRPGRGVHHNRSHLQLPWHLQLLVPVAGQARVGRANILLQALLPNRALGRITRAAHKRVLVVRVGPPAHEARGLALLPTVIALDLLVLRGRPGAIRTILLQVWAARAPAGLSWVKQVQGFIVGGSGSLRGAVPIVPGLNIMSTNCTMVTFPYRLGNARCIYL